MQDTNTRLVREAWGEAFNDRDMEAFLDLHSEAVTFSDPTLPEPISGKGELEGLFLRLFEVFPDCRMEVVRVYGLRDWVCADCFESGTMKGPIKHPAGEIPPTGKPYRIGTILLCRIDGGRIAEVKLFYDLLELTTQLGIKG
jgi:steroid delta-isomerase-like uncharacterized protein